MNGTLVLTDSWSERLAEVLAPPPRLHLLFLCLLSGSVNDGGQGGLEVWSGPRSNPLLPFRLFKVVTMSGGDTVTLLTHESDVESKG